MNKRFWIVGLLALACASCDRLMHRGEPESGVATATTTTMTVTPIIAPRDGGLSPSDLALHLGGGEEEEEEPAVVDGGVTCPIDVHPYYCRRRCRNFSSRQATMHARRMGPSRRSGTGTCGTFKVFAEEAGGDGGPVHSLVEYFDETGNLVGAEDSQRTPCGAFGKVPKGCKLEIQWGPGRTGGLADIGK